MLPPPDPQLQMAVAPFLLPNERLFWTGRPSRGILFQWHDLFLVPFAILWAWVPITSLWEDDGFAQAPAPFVLIPYIFAVVGFYIIIGRFIADMLVRRVTIYAVTDRRVIQLRSFVRPWLRSQDIHNLNAFELNEGMRDRGTIAFDYDGDWWSARGMRWSPAIGRGLRFVAIDQVRDVYALIHDLI